MVMSIVLLNSPLVLIPLVGVDVWRGIGGGLSVEKGSLAVTGIAEGSGVEFEGYAGLQNAVSLKQSRAQKYQARRMCLLFPSLTVRSSGGLPEPG
jgi:hypothetical protein